MRQLSQSLAANLAVLDKMFGTSADYYAKEITIYHCRGSILLFDGTGTALMLTIFALQDSFGTACNVTGDGALTLILTGYANKHHIAEEKREVEAAEVQ